MGGGGGERAKHARMHTYTHTHTHHKGGHEGKRGGRLLWLSPSQIKFV